MKLWLLTQNEVDGYDTFDSCVVAAPDEETARRIDPHGRPIEMNDRLGPAWPHDPSVVTATYLGELTDDWATLSTHVELPVICASFNAG